MDSPTIDCLKSFQDLTVLLHPITGIYALFYGEKCIYVGASTKVAWRISQHKSRISRDTGFYFNRVWVKVCAWEDLAKEEFLAIRALQPKYNKTPQGPRLVERKSLSDIIKVLLPK